MKQISAGTLALLNARGADFSTDGKPMNGAALFERSAPPPAAAPTTIDLDTAGLERAAQANSQATAALLRVVQALVQEVRSQRDASPAPIKEWDFTIQRDDKDRLERIRAKAIR